MSDELSIIIGKRISAARKAKGLTQKDVAKYLGKEAQSIISAYESGTKAISGDDVGRLAKLFDVPVEYLYGRPTASIPVSDNYLSLKIPVYGEVHAGPGGCAFNEYLGDESWTPHNKNDHDYYMLKVKGESMTPRYLPGDFAVIRPQSDVDSGKVAIVIIDGEEGTIKKIQKVHDGIILQSLNSLYAPREFYGEDAKKVIIIGEVVDIRPGRLS